MISGVPIQRAVKNNSPLVGALGCVRQALRIPTCWSGANAVPISPHEASAEVFFKVASASTEDDMPQKPNTSPPTVSRAVTAERAARLYRLLQLLGLGPQTRATLTKRLRLDVRGFYRDLELLRQIGITIQMRKRRYELEGTVEHAVAQLPFPDPGLTLGEAMQLAKGRTLVHRKLKGQIALIIR
jgi:hypothetical protein